MPSSWSGAFFGRTQRGARNWQVHVVGNGNAGFRVNINSADAFTFNRGSGSVFSIPRHGHTNSLSPTFSYQRGPRDSFC